MKPAARVFDLHSCPAASGNVPHVGGPILPMGARATLIGGAFAARQGDPAFCTGVPSTIVFGSPTVLIEGQFAARQGDLTSHGGAITQGCPSVLIGDAGGGAGTPPGATLLAAFAAGAAFTRTGCGTGGAGVEATDQARGTEWIEIEFVDEESDRPLPCQCCLVVAPDGTVFERWSDRDGLVRIDGLPAGTCQVSFPILEPHAWMPG